MRDLRQLLGIELPIVQAPMAGVQGSALAVAVSNAGGLGSLPCAMLGVDEMRAELSAIRAQTARSFNVNFFVHTPPEPDAEQEAGWRALLAPYFEEYGVVASAASGGSARRSFDDAAADVLAEFEPPVVSFHFGLPSEALIAKVRRWDAKILSSATTVAEARWLEARGVDAVIAQGIEAGGHQGGFLPGSSQAQLGTLALVPQVVDAVRVPVIAAGGIADARGVRAALALGASGVQIGTAYLLCPEATTSPLHRAMVKSEAGRLTALTNVFTGRIARGIVNRAVQELGPVSALVPPFPLAASVLAPLRAKAEAQGSADFSALWAGQNTSGCKEIPAGELTREVAS
jgi:nitronate monooxygenase